VIFITPPRPARLQTWQPETTLDFVTQADGLGHCEVSFKTQKISMILPKCFLPFIQLGKKNYNNLY